MEINAGLGTDTGGSKHRAAFTLVSDLHPNKSVIMNASIVDRACHDTPITPVPDINEWKWLDGLDLADPRFNSPG